MEDSIQSGVPIRRRVLFGVAAVSVLFAWHIVLTDSVYRPVLNRLLRRNQAALHPPFHDASRFEAGDPPVGSLLTTEGTGGEIRRKTPASKYGYLLASMGDCSSCTRLNLEKLYSQTRPRGIGLIAVSNGHGEQIRNYAIGLRQNGVDIPLFQDRDGKLAASLNSYYPGRLYFFSPDWKLRWRERDFHIDNYLFITGRFDRLMRNTRS